MTSLWDDPGIIQMLNSADEETKYKFQVFGKYMQDNLDYVQSTSSVQKLDKIETPPDHIDAATQIKLMLRDGLPVAMLKKSEKKLFIDTFGKDQLKQFE